MTTEKDTITIQSRANLEVETANLDELEIQELFERDPARVPNHANFWCISLTVVELKVQMVINMSGDVILGRMGSSSDKYTFIDLSGYRAHEKGVSRQHAFLSLKGNKVVIRDNESTNRTLLNKKKLRPLEDYPLKPGDLISLGKLELKFNMLFNPFSY